ncbi:hypothetical protein [Collimonas sp.]|jgi:hypothetical protein|uniref:hypothetical protein n=1 Tax=Collimonas sp. TaxID=1963772 RepID=UPI002C826366|nr:hypothetical protein [Collimonas sp.]HWW05915.1 hypothetical protein [Collimonas sp.]
MKKIAMLLLLGAMSMTFNAAQAHGNTKPEHGGLIQIDGDMSLELVVGKDGAELYVLDDDDELPSADLSGKLTITSKGTKSEALLKPAGANKFEAKGVKIPSGSTVIAMVVLKDKTSKVSASFTTR